jgi:hypothetical protein
MKKYLLSIVALVLFVAFAQNLNAQSTQLQTVNMVVPSMVYFVVTPSAGTPISLAPVYNPAATPAVPISATDNSSQWTFRSNSGGTYRLTSQISTAMPANTALTVDVTANTVGGSGTSAGVVTLTTTAQDCVTNISGNCTGVITYTFTISDENVSSAPIVQTVTWTVGP